jgi:transcription antitermination factor NusG
MASKEVAVKPKEKLDIGMKVIVTSGIYKGAEGIVADIQAECSVVRIRDKEGDNVYAVLETVQKVG